MPGKKRIGGPRQRRPIICNPVVDDSGAAVKVRSVFHFLMFDQTSENVVVRETSIWGRSVEHNLTLSQEINLTWVESPSHSLDFTGDTVVPNVEFLRPVEHNLTLNHAVNLIWEELVNHDLTINHVAEIPAICQFFNSPDGITINDTFVNTTDGVLQLGSGFDIQGVATSSDVFGLGDSADVLRYNTLLEAQPGGTLLLIQNSNDNSAWTNAAGDDVNITGHWKQDHINDLIEVDDVASWFSDEFDGDVGFSMWHFNTNSTGSNEPVTFTTSDGDALFRYYWARDFNQDPTTNRDGWVSVEVKDGNSNKTISSAFIGQELYDGRWHQFVFVKQSNNFHQYYWDGRKLPMTHPNTGFANINMGSGSTGTMKANRFGNPGEKSGLNRTVFFTGQPTDQAIKDALVSGSPIVGITEYADFPLIANANDISGNARHGTNSNGTFVSDPLLCVAGGYMLGVHGVHYWDGDNDEANITVSDFRSGDNTGTVSLWLKAGVQDEDTVTLFASSDTSSSTTGFKITLETSGSDGTVAIEVDNGDTPTPKYKAALGPDELIDDKWHHIAITSDGSIWKFYVDGVSKAAQSVFGTNRGDWFLDAPTGRDNVTFGYAHESSDKEHFKGIISNVSVADHELTSFEISDEYDLGRFNLDDNVHGWYLEETGSSFVDAIGSEDGSWVGATASINVYRPGIEPTIEMQDVSALSYVDEAYWRAVLVTHDTNVTPTLTEICLTYTPA